MFRASPVKARWTANDFYNALYLSSLCKTEMFPLFEHEFMYLCTCNYAGSMELPGFRICADWKLLSRTKLSEDWQSNIIGTYFCSRRDCFLSFSYFLVGMASLTHLIMTVFVEQTLIKPVRLPKNKALNIFLLCSI